MTILGAMASCVYMIKSSSLLIVYIVVNDQGEKFQIIREDQNINKFYLATSLYEIFVKIGKSFNYFTFYKSFISNVNKQVINTLSGII